jgi:triphosphoribosyl-dephospho-CoA synthetase
MVGANMQKVQEWRNRALQCRRDAESMRDAVGKRTLLELAAVYDRLVAKAEGRLGIGKAHEDAHA